METTTICQKCYQPCDIIADFGEFDVHGPAFTIQTQKHPVDISTCCGGTFKELNSDLVEWHQDVKEYAESIGLGCRISINPEKHRLGFDLDVGPCTELFRTMNRKT